MIVRRIFRRLVLSGRLGGVGRRLADKRVWTIESGEGTGLRIKLPQNRDYLCGSSELPVQRELARRLRPGQTFYDIGANVGFFSLIAARLVGSGGQVYAFEPVPENAASIRVNALHNGFDRIRVFELAAGRLTERAELFVTDWDGGASLSASAVKPNDPVIKRNVRVVALDDLVNEEDLASPGFVKIDVEGVELEVMQGMSKTIARWKPILLYEIDGGDREEFSRRWKQLDDYVAGFGYRISHLEESYPGMNWNVGHSLALPESSP